MKINFQQLRNFFQISLIVLSTILLISQPNLVLAEQEDTTVKDNVNTSISPQELNVFDETLLDNTFEIPQQDNQTNKINGEANIEIPAEPEQEDKKENSDLGINEPTNIYTDTIADKYEPIDTEKSNHADTTNEPLVESNLMIAPTSLSVGSYKLKNKVDGMIIRGGHTIDTLPWGSNGFKTIGRTNDYLGKYVTVYETDNTYYYYIEVDGKPLGWVDKNAVTTNNLNRTDVIISNNYSITNKPEDENGAVTSGVGTTSNFLYQQVIIKEISANENYYFTSDANGQSLGWISKAAFSNSSQRKEAMIVKGGHTVDTLPWGTKGFKTIGSTDRYLGDKVTIFAMENSNKYAFVIAGSEVLGWVDSNALTTDLSSTNNYILFPDYNIDTKPWGESGYKSRGLGTTKNHLNKQVNLYGPSENGSYYFAKDLEGNTLGWIDKKAFSNPEEYQQAMIFKGGHTVDTQPWGSRGFKTIGSTDSYFGDSVTIYAKNSTNHYAYIVKGNEALGWVDINALTTNLKSTKNYIIFPDYNIDTKPWGESGYKSRGLGTTKNHLNKEVNLYGPSKNSGYYFAKDLEGNTLGWIDKKAFSNPEEYQQAMIFKGGHTVDTQPWGSRGFKTIGSTDSYFGDSVTIYAKNSTNHYAYIVKGNEALGWVDVNALTTNLKSTKNYIIFPDYNIDTKPWGESGYKSRGLGTTKNHLNKEVNLYGPSKNNGYYFAKDMDGNTLGWIDKKAFSNPKKRQQGMVVKGSHTVDTLPWGTQGFKTIGSTDNYFGDSVTIYAINSSNHYAYIVKGNEALGWIDKRALSIDTKKELNYILFPGYDIDTKPWGEAGFKSRGLGQTTNYLNKAVYIYETSQNGAYHFAKDMKGNTLGWIDNKAFSNSTEHVKAMITKGGYTVDTKPWGTKGFKTVGDTQNHLGEVVTIVDSRTNNSYAFVAKGEEVLGWVDKKAFIQNYVNEVNYILYPNYTIDNKPWGENGFRSVGVGTTSDHMYQKVIIHGVSSNGSYYFVNGVNSELTGWIDKKAFRNKIYEDLGYETGNPGTVYHPAYRGETVQSIANKYARNGVTVAKLISWNKIPNSGRFDNQTVISLNGMNDYNNYNHEKRAFKTNTEFINYISNYAVEIAGKNNLYASVMIAQAALETGYGSSGLSLMANNMFGIKSSSDYRGYTIIMPTNEEVNGEMIRINDGFRFYPSYSHSIQDNVDKLKNGVSWDPNFYNGTWLENTSSYKDATLFLTGRYATDTKYYSKLNRIIELNNLTRFDKQKYVDRTYNTTVNKTNFEISNLPFDHLPKTNANYKNIEVVGNTKDYLGKTVTVKQINPTGRYANIYQNNKEIGWVKVEALKK